MRTRIRNLGIRIGRFPTGPHNAITDVPGVLVGHETLIYDKPRTARTGVTMIVPRADTIWRDYAFAGYHNFNGNGEMTGMAWLEESGMLGSAIGLTNTFQVGVVRDALVRYVVEQGHTEGFWLPVVAETYDGWLNDIDAFHLTREAAYKALTSATDGPVAEGSVGGGTGMICHDFKGGIGTASRLIENEDITYTLGVLVQANYGDRHLLRVDGVPVGRILGQDNVAIPGWRGQDRSGSIIIIIATDAPLLPVQCRRLAQRATVGLARVGGVGHNGSGDLFLAFATGNHLPAKTGLLRDLKMIPHGRLDPFFEAVAEAVEEAILNALTMADTMVGRNGRIAHALPLDDLQQIVADYRRFDYREERAFDLGQKAR
ncbi:MAG: P1 family peptidase [Anaerolineales bacterium]|nr:P1 family peptidase [Anaerolineales bacterium]